MNESFILKHKKTIVTCAILFLIFIISISIITSILNSRNKKVLISNFSDCISKISTSDSDDVFKTLYDFVNSQNKINNLENSDYYNGEIRSDSCKTEDNAYNNQTISTANFILDLPEQKYSYRVKFDWIKPENETSKTIDLGTTSIYCLNEDESIYSDFGCSQNPAISIETNSIYDLNLNLSENCWVSYAYSETAPTNIKLQIIYYPSDEDYQKGTVDSVKNNCVTSIKNLLTDNHLTLTDYEIVPKLQLFRY